MYLKHDKINVNSWKKNSIVRGTKLVKMIKLFYVCKFYYKEEFWIFFKKMQFFVSIWLFGLRILSGKITNIFK